MNNYPQYIQVEDKKYKINTDFRVALECDEIARDDKIGDYEKALAIIYKLLGEEALKDHSHHDKIMKLIMKYLRCGKSDEELNKEDNKQPSMSLKQDQGYIKASFMSDYGIDLDKANLEWWAFNDYLTGLKEDCIMNRVRYIREESLDGKKGKEYDEWVKAKEQVALKYEKTYKELELDKKWEELMRKE